MRDWRVTYETRCGATRTEFVVFDGRPDLVRLVALSQRIRVTAVDDEPSCSAVHFDVRRFDLYDSDSWARTALYRESE